MLDVLVQLQNQESCSSNHYGLHLTNNHLKAVTADLLSAGTERVATAMEWALSELVKNPRVMEKAQAEVRERFEGKTRIEEADNENLSYLKLVVKESLRLHPPGVLLPREARETCEIGGYKIPVQTNIIVNVWALSRDPKNWTEPDVFKPERFLDTPVDFKGTDYEFLPFGAEWNSSKVGATDSFPLVHLTDLIFSDVKKMEGSTTHGGTKIDERNKDIKHT